MSLKIWSHNPGSNTARELAARLRCRILAAPDESRWRPSRGDVIINFGNSEWTDNIKGQEAYRDGYTVLNHPAYVDEMSNKLIALQHIENAGAVAVVPFTEDINLVRMWLENGSDVVARHKLRGHSGEGIEIIPHEGFRNGNGHVPAAPLYTKYIRKSVEHRVHMFRLEGTMSYIWQQKRRRIDCDQPNWAVRNYENGFIYAVEDVQKPANYREIEAGLEECIDLCFGAIDLITPNSTNARGMRDRGPMLLEVNTAPGLSSPTMLDWYVTNFKERIRNARR